MSKDNSPEIPNSENNGRQQGKPQTRGSGADKYGKRKRKSCNYDKLKSNDISYYNKYPELYNAAIQVPWSQIMGHEVDISTVRHGQPYGNMNLVMPGIMRIDVAPTIGAARSSSDPANIAFQNMMAQLYGKTNSSASLPFQQTDMAMLNISMAGVTGMFAHAKRILEARNFWITKNIYYPRAIVKSLGYDFDDLVSNAVLYESRLNTLIYEFNSMAIPNFLDIYERQYSMFHNIYVDEDSDMGQLYVFNPVGYYYYVDTPTTGPSYCQYILWNPAEDANPSTNTYTKFNVLLDRIEDAMNAWRTSDDYYSITGAMRRAYPENEFIAIEPFASGKTINPIVDEVMMMQIMNATIHPTLNNMNITQDPVNNLIKFVPYERIPDGGTNIRYSDILLRAYKYNVSGEDIMEMTRLTNLHSPSDLSTDDEDTPILWLNHCGPELVTGFTVIKWDTNDGEIIKTTNYCSNIVEVSLRNGATASASDAAISYLLAANFRYCPSLVLDTVEGGPIYMSDIYNYTVLKYDAWKQLNKAAMFSLYKIKDVNIKT